MNSAALIIEVSAICAVAMSVFFGALIIRRWRIEVRTARDREMLAEITRNYLQRVAGQRIAETPKKWPDYLKLRAVSHIHLLLRGGERDHLMQMAELDGLLERTIDNSRSSRRAKRIDAIRLLQQFGSEACIARLRQLLTRDPNSKVRTEAAFALASIKALPPPRELIRILGMFDRQPSRLDSALLRASAPQYHEHLRMILEDDIPSSQRALIVDALGWADDPAVLPTLRVAAESENPELRSAALRAAARLGHPSVEEWVLRLLDDPVPFVRVQAANCCASLALGAAVPRLRDMLEDEHLWARLRAEHALDVLVAQWPSDELFGTAA